MRCTRCSRDCFLRQTGTWRMSLRPSGRRMQQGRTSFACNCGQGLDRTLSFFSHQSMRRQCRTALLRHFRLSRACPRTRPSCGGCLPTRNHCEKNSMQRMLPSLVPTRCSLQRTCALRRRLVLLPRNGGVCSIIRGRHCIWIRQLTRVRYCGLLSSGSPSHAPTPLF